MYSALSGRAAMPRSIQGSTPTSGIEFLENDASGSDIRLAWTGANLLPRTSHTAIWQAKYAQQLGYYAVAWSTGSDGTWPANEYEFGTHPYPTTGTYDGNGQSTGGTGGTGAVHYMEIAGLGASDFIEGPMEPYLLVTDGRWLTQARTCEITGGDTVTHRFYPDVVNNPSMYIEKTVTKTAFDAITPTSPAFIIGCSPWTDSGSTNNETPNAVINGIRLFDTVLTITDIATEASVADDSAATAAGQANTWYINDNPTHTDVTDKSGEGHNPSWANANRPTLWSA